MVFLKSLTDSPDRPLLIEAFNDSLVDFGNTQATSRGSPLDQSL